MELILVLAFAWAGVRAIGETIANTAAAVRGTALPYPPAGSGRVRTRTAAGGTVSYATGRGGGALAGLAWESGKSGWAKGWSWGTTRVQAARIRRGANRTREAAERARRTVQALDTAVVDEPASDRPAGRGGSAENAAPTLDTRAAGQRRGPFDGDPQYTPSTRAVVHDTSTYLMGAELAAWKLRHPEAAAAGYGQPDRYGGAWIDAAGKFGQAPAGFEGSPAEKRLQDLRHAGYDGPVDAAGYVKHPADLTPSQQDLLRAIGYQHNPPDGAERRPVDGPSSAAEGPAAPAAAAAGIPAGPQPAGPQPAAPQPAAGQSGRHLSAVPSLASWLSVPGDSSPPMSGDPGPGAVTTTEGNTMTTTTGETTSIEATRTYLTDLAGHVQSDILSQLELADSTLRANNVDQATLGDLDGIREQFNQAVTALGDIVTGINDRHAAVEEAINSTPEVADTDWYRNQ